MQLLDVPSTTAERVSPTLGVMRWMAKWDWAALLQFSILVVQLGLLALVIRTFSLQNKAFLYILAIGCPGFVIHHFLPMRARMPFFVVLSLAGIAIVLGLVNAAWLIGTGMLLIGMAHLPIPFAARVTMLVTVAAVMAACRGGWMSAPMPPAIWTILGSMFMFRLMLYVYDLSHRSAPFSFARAMAYFFMLPNVCFPLFPVVGYKAFCRSHYNGEALAIYQKGLGWMFRGIIHLMLFRLVYQNLLIDSAEVTNAVSAARYMAAAFLLYLRVSGDFHLIVGMLHLFGFNLSETFHRWLMSSSFTDFWRRINIYWKDFMLKMFFNPAYFRFKKRMSHNQALFAATAFVFVVTWFLHSYQWFWIRGTFPLTWQDTVFWIFIGTMVLTNMFLENKFGRRRSLRKQRRTLAQDALLAAKTISMFVTIAIVWALWTSDSFEEWLMIMRALTRVTPAAVAWIGGSLAALGMAAVYYARRSPEQAKAADLAATAKAGGIAWRPALTIGIVCSLILVVGRFPELLESQPALAGVVIKMKSDSRLSRRDQNNMDENYYEALGNPGAYSPALAQIYLGRPHDWNINPAVKQNPNGFPPYDHLPSITTPYKGATWITNRWGMRDRDYAKHKPSGTYRIAMLGASHTAGAGVEGHETFENLVEDRLNRECTNDKYRKFEIMNFAVGGYGPLCKLAKMQQQLFEFQPDAVLYVAIDDFTWIVREMANATEKEIPIPYSYINATTKKVGATKRMPKSFVATRLEPHKVELVRWVYAEFVQQCRDHRVHPFAAFIPKPDYKGSNRDAIPLQLKLAAEAGFTTLDVSDAYDELEDIETLWVAKWDRHPNPYGHQLLAKKLYRRLVTELVSMGVVDADADVVTRRGKKNRPRRDVSLSSAGNGSQHFTRSSSNHKSDVYQAVIFDW